MVFKFTIDNWVNPYVPKNKVPNIPFSIVRRFLGKHETTPKHDFLIWLEILVASFAGISLLEGVFKSQTVFTSHHAPIIIASYGATAILCFNSIAAPLAQPRNIIMGNFVSSVIGVCVQKLFLLSKHGRDNYWASGGLSVGVSSVVMTVLNCVHPPGGAAALLPSIDESIQEMSWWYIPMHLVSSVLIISVALITGNIIRAYPVYWWSPAPVGPPPPVSPPPSPKLEPVNGTPTTGVWSAPSSADLEKNSPPMEGISERIGLSSIIIEDEDISIPKGLDLSELEVQWLGELQTKIKNLSK